jgi:hypothetical protein
MLTPSYLSMLRYKQMLHCSRITVLDGVQDPVERVQLSDEQDRERPVASASSFYFFSLEGDQC